MKQAKTVQVGISGREIKDFKSLWQTFKNLWQNTDANPNIAFLSSLEPIFGVLFLDLWNSSEEGGKKRNCLDTSEKNRMTCKAAVGVLGNPESKAKTRKSTHYFEP